MAPRAQVMLLLTILGASGGGARPPFAVHPIALPGAPPGGVLMDYLAYDRAHRRVWVPAGNTASVDVVDVTDDRVTRIAGFPTATVDRHGTRRSLGPSAATVGDGTVYVGNRGDSSVCALDAASLRKGACVTLESMPDGLAYVAATREVWVTTPQDHAIIVLDAPAGGAPAWKARFRLPGRPEGFAVDDARGVFYTNLEDADRTLTIDLARREVTRTWAPGCGAGGPRGLALDRGLDLLLVACGDRVQVLDAGHDGRRLATIGTGDGVDNIDYLEPRRTLYAAAARAATLTVARLDAHGGLTVVAVVPTAAGARNAVATDDGTAYLTDSRAGRLLVVAAAGRPMTRRRAAGCRSGR